LGKIVKNGGSRDSGHTPFRDGLSIYLHAKFDDSSFSRPSDVIGGVKI